LSKKYLVLFALFLLITDKKKKNNGLNNSNASKLSIVIIYSCRYEKHLSDAKTSGIRKGMINGFTMGFLWLIVDCCYALGTLSLSNCLPFDIFSFFIIGFWYGAKLIRDGEYNIGNVIIVSFEKKKKSTLFKSLFSGLFCNYHCCIQFGSSRSTFSSIN
jgi:hypothetical protein